MALLHRADLRPTKLELLTAWLPTRPWYRGPADPVLTRAAAGRFDDPAGAVGLETIVVRVEGGPLLHTPLTYRDAPLPGAEAWLVGTSEHSVLGRRWVYDGCGDPVYAAALVHALVTGAGAAEEFVDIDGRPERREPIMWLQSHGSETAEEFEAGALVRVDDADPTVVDTATIRLAVRRQLDANAAPGPDPLSLTATWTDQPTPVLLVSARTR